jgi:hypothetical protein
VGSTGFSRGSYTKTFIANGRFAGVTYALFEAEKGLEGPAWPIRIQRKREGAMARYGKAASRSVKNAMHRKKKGTLRSGKGGKGGRVKSRKQAVAIGLSEARKKGAKVPRKRSS